MLICHADVHPRTGLIYEFALIGYSNTWRQRRRVFHNFFHRDAVSQYRPIHRRGVQRLLDKLLNDPAQFLDHCRQ